MRSAEAAEVTHALADNGLTARDDVMASSEIDIE